MAVFVAGLNASFPTTTVDRAIAEAVRRFDYCRATEDQANAIRELVAGRDVFVTLPTGSGQIALLWCPTFVFDFLRA